jgi:hypothetical protein
VILKQERSMQTIMMRVGVVSALISGGMVLVGSARMDDKPSASPTAVQQATAMKSESPLKDVAWMAGAYMQTSDRGMSEEHWSAPHGNSMMGMFRWCKADGTPSMFELLTITREGEGDSAKTVLRLRHYSAKLGAKEEKDEPLTLVLESSEANKAVFAASEHAGDLSKVTYQRSESAGMQITVEFTPSLNRGALRFDMKPIGTGATPKP